MVRESLFVEIMSEYKPKSRQGIGGCRGSSGEEAEEWYVQRL